MNALMRSIAVTLLLAATWAAEAEAAIRICAAVEAPKAERSALEKLLADQLARHRSHQLVESDCESKLAVQLFTLAGQRYLTLRIDRALPVRYTVADGKTLARNLAEGLRRVLNSDPSYLSRNIGQASRLARDARALLIRGETRLRGEIFQVLGTDGDRLAAPTGLALALHRGAGNLQVFARLFFASDPAGSQRRRLRYFTGADAGVSYEFNRRALHAPYLSLGIGAQLLHFVGRSQLDNPSSEQTASKAGAALSLRVGYRFFRAHNFDLDLFGLGYLPLYRTRDEDSALIDAYTPMAVVGLGVGF